MLTMITVHTVQFNRKRKLTINSKKQKLSLIKLKNKRNRYILLYRVTISSYNLVRYRDKSNAWRYKNRKRKKFRCYLLISCGVERNVTFHKEIKTISTKAFLYPINQKERKLKYFTKTNQCIVSNVSRNVSKVRSLSNNVSTINNPKTFPQINWIISDFRLSTSNRSFFSLAHKKNNQCWWYRVSNNKNV